MSSKRKIDIQLNTSSPVLGETIRQCRLALKMTPREFADRLRTSLTFVLQIERAEVPITSQILEDCAAILGISTAELLEIASSEKIMRLVTAPGNDNPMASSA